MSILFLDFDGVLHPIMGAEPVFCRNELLWKVLRACPDVSVVFSTSWRETYKFDELLDFVTYGGGEDLERRFIGSTPLILREPMANITGAASREQECRLWLSGNGHRQPWIALDDTAESFAAACPMLYLVNKDTGISAADADTLIEKMNGWRSL